MPDFALRLQMLKSAELVFGGYLRIDSMQLVEIDPVQTQAAQTAFAGGLEMRRPSVFDPLVGTSPFEAALCGDHQAGRVWMQSFGDDLFTHVGAIGIRGVDKIDSQFDSAPHDADGLGPVCGFAPYALTSDTHC